MKGRKSALACKHHGIALEVVGVLSGPRAARRGDSCRACIASRRWLVPKTNLAARLLAMADALKPSGQKNLTEKEWQALEVALREIERALAAWREKR